MSKTMSSPMPAHQTSGSDEDPHLMTDQRKRKRMLSNRESARRSRMRKQQHLDGLINELAQLKNENGRISMQVDLFARQYVGIESENTILRNQLMGLAERLQSLNSVLRFVEESSGMVMDISEVPDQLLNPWLFGCMARPISTTAEMYKC